VNFRLIPSDGDKLSGGHNADTFRPRRVQIGASREAAEFFEARGLQINLSPKEEFQCSRVQKLVLRSHWLSAA
jgi:hypothetical protein